MIQNISYDMKHFTLVISLNILKEAHEDLFALCQKIYQIQGFLYPNIFINSVVICILLLNEVVCNFIICPFRCFLFFFLRYKSDKRQFSKTQQGKKNLNLKLVDGIIYIVVYDLCILNGGKKINIHFSISKTGN